MTDGPGREGRRAPDRDEPTGPAEAGESPSGDDLVARRLELVDRGDELGRILRRTRLTAPVWAAGVVLFVWMGWATSSWGPALVMAGFAAVAAGVNAELRRRRRAELREVRDRLERLPPPS